MLMILLFVILFILSLVLTGLVRKFALHKAILDIPNERSAHSIPTPRGGGIAIIISFFLGILILYYLNITNLALLAALTLGGSLVAIIGYLDDLYHIPASWRALIHVIAAITALYFLGGLPIIDLGFTKLHLGIFGWLLGILGIVWLINLYNFMDGVDGIAGIEAIFVAIAAGIFLFITGANSIAATTLMLIAAVTGFLYWNWPPAKIFMGDVGSGFLGYVFAVLIIATANQQAFSPFIWLTLIAIFIFDATFTLIHRIFRKQKWYLAHREHIYQRLLKFNKTHKQIIILVTLINIFIIFPLAWLMFYWPKIAFIWFLFLLLLFSIIWKIIVRKT